MDLMIGILNRWKGAVYFSVMLRSDFDLEFCK